jgi:hypothetical protein
MMMDSVNRCQNEHDAALMDMGEWVMNGCLQEDATLIGGVFFGDGTLDCWKLGVPARLIVGFGVGFSLVVLGFPYTVMRMQRP